MGRVIDEKLDADGTGAQLVLFIDAPHDRFVSQSTRFWNVSGVEVSLGAERHEPQNAVAHVGAGGRGRVRDAPTIQASLSRRRQRSSLCTRTRRRPWRRPMASLATYECALNSHCAGSRIGAPVEFVGVNIGSVLSIDLDYDAKSQRFPVIVTARIYPRRMGRAYDALSAAGRDRKRGQNGAAGGTTRRPGIARAAARREPNHPATLPGVGFHARRKQGALRRFGKAGGDPDDPRRYRRAAIEDSRASSTRSMRLPLGDIAQRSRWRLGQPAWNVRSHQCRRASGRNEHVWGHCIPRSAISIECWRTTHRGATAWNKHWARRDVPCVPFAR